jgi:hypothetical protein
VEVEVEVEVEVKVKVSVVEDLWGFERLQSNAGP